MRFCIGGLAAAACLVLCPSAGAIGPAVTPPSDQQRIERLISQLGDEDYFVRERAQQELAKIGFKAFDALSAAEEHDDIEVAARAKFLVRQMRIEWTVDSDPPEVKRLLQNYGLKDDAARLATVEQLAALEDDKGLAVLCRLVRFEKSALLAKVAALAALEGKVQKEVDWQRRESTINDSLGPSSRPGAQWLHTFALAHRDPSGAADQWTQHAEAEEKTLKQSPQLSQGAFAAALWRQRVGLLKRLDRQDDAVAAMIRVVALDDDNESLLELVDWLARERAWNSIDEVATRFTDRFQRDPILLYTLAQGCKSQGNDAAASKNAEKASQLNEGDPLKHLRVAVQLQQHGWFDWSQREYRQVIKIGPPGQSFALQAQFFLAEMQYDQADYQAAAKTLEEATDTFKGKDQDGLDQQIAETSRTVNETLTRLHFFRACQHEAAGQRDRQLSELLAGLKLVPDDVDVLIALFSFPNLDAATREGVRKRIGQCAESFRQDIKNSPDEATAYNQLAWLIANTEGDKQEAIRASQKSLELRPGSAGFLDTLARCYYAAGDLENAVKHQSQAVEIDPHSGQMNRQLKLFGDALAKNKQKP